MRTTYISENGRFYEVKESKEYSYFLRTEITEEEYGKSTESLYYYQLIRNKGDVLNEKYLCCGLVHEIKKDKEFYVDYFLHHDSRCGSTEVEYIEKLVIVKGFRGNVAERDGLAITSEDIVEEYLK